MYLEDLEVVYEVAHRAMQTDFKFEEGHKANIVRSRLGAKDFMGGDFYYLIPW